MIYRVRKSKVSFIKKNKAEFAKILNRKHFKLRKFQEFLEKVVQKSIWSSEKVIQKNSMKWKICNKVKILHRAAFYSSMNMLTDNTSTHFKT